MSKYSVKDAKDIQNSCFKLNSLQLRALLTGYLYADNEPHIPPVSPALILSSRGWNLGHQQVTEEKHVRV